LQCCQLVFPFFFLLEDFLGTSVQTQVSWLFYSCFVHCWSSYLKDTMCSLLSMDLLIGTNLASIIEVVTQR
jgi:hypothetical protein